MLTDFFAAYVHWLDKGAPPARPFNRNYGLCTNIQKDYGDSAYDAFDELLSAEFPTNKLHPFDDTWIDYVVSAVSHTQHLNPLRNAWVRAKHYNDPVLTALTNMKFGRNREDYAGICSNLRWAGADISWLSLAIEAWPGHSGDITYPVPHPTLSPYEAYHKPGSLWDATTEYGRNRLALLNFLIERRTNGLRAIQG